MRGLKEKGFSLLELMLVLMVSIFVVGSYLKIFNHSVKAEGHNNLKNNITLKGEHILTSFENAVRLTGLANSSQNFKDGLVIPQAQGIAANVDAGNYLAGMAVFTFLSPYGGPVTKTVNTAVTDGSGCILTLQSSASFFNTANPKISILNKGTNAGEVYTASYAATTSNVLVASSFQPALTDTCENTFPMGTLVTGANISYEFSYINNTVKLAGLGDSPILFTYPREEMPFVLLQFLVEIVDENGAVTLREWKATPTSPERPFIKAVRFGFVLTSREEREDKTVAGNAFRYCFFESQYCFSAPLNTRKRYTPFSRVIYIRNYDYLQKNIAGAP